MRMNDAFPVKYLTADDVEPSRDVTIRVVMVEEVGSEEKKESKPIVYFKEVDKGVVLNKTNFSSVVDITKEEDSDLWADKRVNLYRAMTQFQGKSVPCIRIRPCNAGSQEYLSPLFQRQLVDRCKAAKVTEEGIKRFIKEEMGRDGMRFLTEKQFGEVMQCLDMGVVTDWCKEKGIAAE